MRLFQTAEHITIYIGLLPRIISHFEQGWPQYSYLKHMFALLSGYCHFFPLIANRTSWACFVLWPILCTL